MADRALADKQYKDGYQVIEGGDYLVHTEGTKYDGRHMMIRIADGTVMGEYVRRETANRRAQELGGNSRLPRHLNYTVSRRIHSNGQGSTGRNASLQKLKWRLRWPDAPR